MRFGYTIADAASRKVFEDAARFITEKLNFKASHDFPEDVDGSIKKEFAREDGNLILESDAQVDYVAIISDVELPIDCLHSWVA